MAIASLVLGILGIIFALVPVTNIIPLVLGIVGLILGYQARKNGLEDEKMVKAGIILNIIAIVLSLALFIACTSCMACVACLA